MSSEEAINNGNGNVKAINRKRSEAVLKVKDCIVCKMANKVSFD